MFRHDSVDFLLQRPHRFQAPQHGQVGVGEAAVGLINLLCHQAGSDHALEEVADELWVHSNQQLRLRAVDIHRANLEREREGGDGSISTSRQNQVTLTKV